MTHRCRNTLRRVQLKLLAGGAARPAGRSPRYISCLIPAANRKFKFSPGSLIFRQHMHYQQHQHLKLHRMVLLIMSSANLDIFDMMNGTVS